MSLKKYPFKFLDPYAKEDNDIFFGRKEEIEDLYRMVSETNLVLVYGASGTGKTSLIQCGLASKFLSYEWLPLFIRRKGNLNDTLKDKLAKEEGIKQEEAGLDWLNEDWTSNGFSNKQIKVLSPIGNKVKAVFKKHSKPIFLIFDQLEELFILGDKNEQNQFIQNIQDILRLPEPITIILSIREEFLGYLYEFERKIPRLLDKKLRVEPMHLEKVIKVIKGIGDAESNNVSLKAEETNAIALEIFEKLRNNEQTIFIQLPYLQVFLDKLYLLITKDEKRKSHAIFNLNALNKIGELGDILREFLDEQVLKIAQQSEKTPEVIWAILSPFVTLEGTKEPTSKENIYKRFSEFNTSFVDFILDAFVKYRILRYREEEQLYEITHDALAKQVLNKRTDEEIALLEVQRLINSQALLNAETREFFSEKQLLFIDPYLGKLNLKKAEQQFLESSRQHVAVKKEKERKKQIAEYNKIKAQAEKEHSLRTEAEKNANRAKRFTWLAISIAILALSLAYTARSYYLDAENKRIKEEIANKKVQETYNQLIKAQRMEKIKKIIGYAKEYDSFGQDSLKCKNYKIALDSMRYYSEDSLFLEIKKQTELCKKENSY